MSEEMALERSRAFAALALAVMTLAPGHAFASPRAGYVTAYSDYGNGRVRAPVRAAQFGYQVKLPGGPWLYCEKNSLFFGRNGPCSETLRRESVDFWETRSEEHGGSGR